MTARKPSAPLRRTFDAIVRVLRWHRRIISALAAGIAVLAGLSAVQPPRVPTTTVVAAAHDLSGGTTLSAADLVRLELPQEVVPAGSFSDVAGALGRVVNAPVSARSPITSATVSTGAALARPGYVVVAVPLQNGALADLLQAGTRIDLLASGRASPVAANARVVAPPGSDGGGGILASGQRALLVEVTPEAAALVVAAIDAGSLGVAVH